MIRSDDCLPDGAAALLNPEIATHGLLEPDHELHRDGLIEAQTLALGVDELVSLLEREIVPLARRGSPRHLPARPSRSRT